MKKLEDTLKDVEAKIKRLWNENPIIVIFAGIAAANAGAKVMQANTDRKRAKTHDREVRRRERMN